MLVSGEGGWVRGEWGGVEELRECAHMHFFTCLSSIFIPAWFENRMYAAIRSRLSRYLFPTGVYFGDRQAVMI